MREFDYGAAIHVYHLKLGTERAVDEPPGCAETGDCGQQADVKILRCRSYGVDSIASPEIDDKNPCFD